MSNSDQLESPVYVFEVLALQKKNGGEPIGQEFARDKDAMEWIMKQPAHKKFVMLRVITGGAQAEEPE